MKCTLQFTALAMQQQAPVLYFQQTEVHCRPICFVALHIGAAGVRLSNLWASQCWALGFQPQG